MNNLTFMQAKNIVSDFRDKTFTSFLLKKVPDYQGIMEQIISTVESGKIDELSTEHINSLVSFNIYIPYLSYSKDAQEDFFTFLDGYILMLSNFNKCLENDKYIQLKKSIYVLESLHKSKDNFETLIFLSDELLNRYKDQFERAPLDLSVRFIQSFLEDDKNDY